MKKGVLYWITGLSGAGKTTIGNYLYYSLKKEQDNVILLDGDVLKKIVSDNPTYTDEDRRSRAMKYARLCKILTDQGLVVICCTIAMYQNVRDWNRENNRGYVEVFLDVPLEVLRQRDQKGMYSAQKNGELSTSLAGVDLDVEFPQNPDITIINDGNLSVKECVKEILDHKVRYSGDFDRDISYWNLYYASDPSIHKPSLFAEYLINQKKDQSLSLLELGCGNGRDSVYFADNGFDVTAIDASDKAITDLNEIYGERSGLRFVCDDFVCSTAIFQGLYDICYSRFTLHSINEEQGKMVIANVYNALKMGGGEFWIEVRSVNDPLCGKGQNAGHNAWYYNGHYRRFIVRKELEKELMSVGFEIKYSAEESGFAPFGNEDPPIIRIIAQKYI